MTSFRLNIVFSGIDFDDDEAFEALADLHGVVWHGQGSIAYATGIIDALSATKAAELLARDVCSRVPSARPIRLDEDLVGLTDIANRIGVTSEAVRNWATGNRRAHFPLPRGIVGAGIKVWKWAEVSVWLRDNFLLGDDNEFPTGKETVDIDALFANFLTVRSTVPTHVLGLTVSNPDAWPAAASAEASWSCAKPKSVRLRVVAAVRPAA